MTRPILAESELEGLAVAHRPALLRHCYRMLGGLADAEDQVQETLLRAWQGREGFEGRASARNWLFRIATNACLNAIEDRARRRLPEHVRPPAEPGEALAERVTEPVWLEPLPDSAVDVERRERVGLAFVAALQNLPARQRAVLLLRDVIGWETKEVAGLLDMTAGAVESALLRARRSIEGAAGSEHAPLKPEDEAMLSRYVATWERGDVAGLAALLREDAVLSMPPVPTWFRGRDAIRRFLAESPPLQRLWRDGFRLVRTAANGGPAFGVYRGDGGAFVAHSLMVLEIPCGQVARLTTFIDASLLPRFGLPPSV